MGKGAKQITTGYTYNGSNAQIICIGPVDILHQILNGDTVIWTGPVFRSSADSDGKTVLNTSIGTIRFYWGTMTQNVDSILAALYIDTGSGPATALMPPLRGVCYAVNVDINFGQQVTPPTLLFEVSKFTTNLALTGRMTRVTITNAGTGYANGTYALGITGGGGSGAAGTYTVDGGIVTTITITNNGSGYTSAPAIAFPSGGGSGAAAVATTFHEINGDAILPEVFYDLFTNTLYGCGLATSLVNAQSFIDAANTIIAEGVGVSPTIDQNQDMRQLLGKLLQYVDAAIYLNAGQVNLKLIRKESTTGILSLSEADYAEEPKPDNKGFPETWNFTLLKFTDRLNKWEDGIEPYDDSANNAIVGETVSKEFNLGFITLRAVAKVIAKNLGIKGGLPPKFWTLRLLPKHRGIRPGQLMFVSYAKRGIVNQLVRCMEIVIGDTKQPDVDVTVMEEMTRDPSNDYVPPDDAFNVASQIGADGTGAFTPTSTTPRLLVLPTTLKAGKLDGWLTAMNRPDAVMDSNKTLWTWDETKMTYQQVDTRQNFPIKAQTIIWWKCRGGTNWLFRVKLPATWDFAAMTNLGGNAPEFYMVTARRTVKEGAPTQDIHQVDGLWCQKIGSGYFTAFAADTYDIEMSAAAFGSLAPILETIADPGNFPTLHCYFGRKDDFEIVTSDVIYFDRYGPNTPVSTYTGHGAPVTNKDTNWIRYVKTPVGNYAAEQQLSDVTAVSYARKDTTQCPDGTYSLDWGAKALTAYEMFDTSGGKLVLGTTDADYPNVFDFDDGLGAIFGGTETETQFFLTESPDLVLGAVVLAAPAAAGIYNDAP